MNYVPDASVALCWVVRRPLSAKALRLRDDYGAKILFYRAVDISSQTRSAYYDCLYVALAEREECELVTADERLLNSLGRQFPFVIPLSSL
jgi:predicted nucleic acid-binding protein